MKLIRHPLSGQRIANPSNNFRLIGRKFPQFVRLQTACRNNLASFGLCGPISVLSTGRDVINIARHLQRKVLRKLVKFIEHRFERVI